MGFLQRLIMPIIHTGFYRHHVWLSALKKYDQLIEEYGGKALEKTGRGIVSGDGLGC